MGLLLRRVASDVCSYKFSRDKVSMRALSETGTDVSTAAAYLRMKKLHQNSENTCNHSKPARVA
jgi:hypothetical protein